MEILPFSISKIKKKKKEKSAVSLARTNINLSEKLESFMYSLKPKTRKLSLYFISKEVIKGITPCN